MSFQYADVSSSDVDASDWDEEETARALSPTLLRSVTVLPREYIVFSDSHAQHAVLSEADYVASLHKLFTFRSMSEFTEKFAKHCGEKFLQPSVSLRVFQSDVTPVWEAPENRNGGKFVLSILGRQEENVLSVWQALLALMCHERLGGDAKDPLVGAVLSCKDWGVTISLWNTDCKNYKLIAKVKRRMRKLFGTHSVKYQVHAERPKGSTLQKDKTSATDMSSGSISMDNSSNNISSSNNSIGNNNNNNNNNYFGNSSGAVTRTVVIGSKSESRRAAAAESPLTVTRAPPSQPLLDVRTILLVIAAFFGLAVAAFVASTLSL